MSRKGCKDKRGDLGRFEEKYCPEPNTGCWLWTGFIDSRGYGKFYFKEKVTLASRASYEMFKGVDPKNKFVCHKCDTPACVNPDHLFLGDHKANMDDMWGKGRGKAGLYQKAKTHCINGHAYDEQNTSIILGKNGKPERRCKICPKLRERAKREARGAPIRLKARRD